MIQVDGVPGLTQARNLGEAELMAREFIAVSLDKEIEDVEVGLDLGELGETVRMIAEKRRAAERLEREASRLAVATATELNRNGVSMRDIGTALGVSHQRVHQLVNRG